MNKHEFIAKVAEKGFTKKSVLEMLDAITSTIQESLESGESIKIVGFGTFYTDVRGDYEARNPKTNVKVIVPAHTIPKFKFAKVYKDSFK